MASRAVPGIIVLALILVVAGIGGGPARRARSGSRLLPMIRAVQAMGFKSNASVAAELNARKVPTARGKEWTSVCPSPVI
jgi:hypothetical protein